MRIIRHYAHVAPLSPLATRPFFGATPLSFHAPSACYCVLTISIHKTSGKSLCVCVLASMQIYCVLLPPSCGMLPAFQMPLESPAPLSFWFRICICGRREACPDRDWRRRGSGSWDLGAKVCQCVISNAFCRLNVAGHIIAIKESK